MKSLCIPCFLTLEQSIIWEPQKNTTNITEIFIRVSIIITLFIIFIFYI